MLMQHIHTDRLESLVCYQLEQEKRTANNLRLEEQTQGRAAREDEQNSKSTRNRKSHSETP